jgi:hypothetical protein
VDEARDLAVRELDVQAFLELANGPHLAIGVQ